MARVGVKSDEKPGPARRRRWQIAAAALVTLVAATWLLGPLLLARVGHWLIVQDELQPADAIFVHGGHLPFRELEGGELYDRGLAPRVWLAPIAPTAASQALATLGVDVPPDWYWAKQVLVASGVPEQAIEVLPERVLSTADEIRAVVAELQARDLDTVILVTSAQHCRRVHVLWHRLAPASLTGIVRASRHDPFDPDAWWTNTEDGQAVLHELAGLLNIWLGTGLRPERQ